MPQFVSPSTGNIFQLNTTMVGQAEARAVCNQQGGHLAIYWTVQEQVWHCCCLGLSGRPVVAIRTCAMHVQLLLTCAPSVRLTHRGAHMQWPCLFEHICPHPYPHPHLPPPGLVKS